MNVRLHPHARARLKERGATEEEVLGTIGRGERFAAKHGRTGFRCNFPFDGEWNARRYSAKQPEYNVAYIRFREKPEQVTTIKISDDMNIDITPDGTVYGLELLNANEQLTADQGALIVEWGGRRHKISLVA